MLRVLKKLIRTCWILFAFLPLVHGFTPEQLDQVIRGTELVANDRFSPALKIFRDLQETLPEHPVGFFFELAILEKLQTDYMTDYHEKQFKRLYKRAKKVAQRYIEAHPDDAYGYFFQGGIQGYHGIHFFRTEKKLSVFIDAIKALSNLKRAYRMNPELWDIYYGLGIYRYWKSVYASFLNPFQLRRKKNRQEGIRYLRLASEKGLYSKGEATGALIRVLRHEKRYDEALAITDREIEKYPGSFFLRQFRSSILKRLGKWEALYRESLVMEQMLSEKPWSSPEARIYSLYMKGLGAEQLGRLHEARKIYQDMLEIYRKNRDKVEINRKYVSRASKRLRKMRRQDRRERKQAIKNGTLTPLPRNYFD